MGRTAYLAPRKDLVARSRRPLVAALAGLLVLAASAPADAAPLPTRLTRALTVSGVSWRATGATVVDLRTRRVVYARNASRSLRPASNEKLPVALAALDELGPNYRISTFVLGEGSLDGAVWRGQLVLEGRGDPTLRLADLVQLARRLRATGIRRVTGGVVADESYFDRRRTAPGWKPSFYKEECPPLSALVVDRGKVGTRTATDPALRAAGVFKRVLRAAGIRVAGAAGKGVAGARAVPLARVRSPTVATLVRMMNRVSDNYFAETLLKHLGARELGHGSTRAGRRVVVRALRARSIPLRGVRIVDGSGLSSYNRLTARAVAALLVSAWRDDVVRTPLFVSLPVAGVNGTLRDRLTRGPARGNVRAKTGTLKTAAALSGYVRTRYVFSILQNGNPLPLSSARRGQDRFVEVLARAR